LQQKKYRITHKLFIAEGIKVIEELLKSNFELEHLYTSQDDFDDVLQKDIGAWRFENKALATPNSCLALFKIPTEKSKGVSILLALDSVRDPGNLGTILRLCDWFGLNNYYAQRRRYIIQK
jgi:TrmH family RNA methyltransferase